MSSSIIDILKSHHAVCVEGSGERCREAIFSAIEGVYGISAHGHPDLYRYNEPRLSIETVRRIREEQSRLPVSSSKTVIVIETDSISQESQNALLKSFEDPAPTTVFVLILPHLSGLLPTLRSRLAFAMQADKPTDVSASRGAELRGGINVTAFLAAAPAQRLEMLGPLLEEKDRSAARCFLDECERVLVFGRKSGEAYTKRERDSLETLTKYKQYIEDPGSSLKLLLEYVALRI
ncbi:MAG: hypothetical protein WDZ79_01090 [Candidatus Paceibacterota bacterium]